MFADLLRQHLGTLIDLSSEQIKQLEAHYELLCRWNKVLNLTAVRSLEMMVEVHYCESVFLGIHLPPGQMRIADIGSGAGFPGIPVAILRPESAVALIESHQRKAVFLREATREMRNIHVIADRAETVTEHFDWVVSRAVNYAEIEKTLANLADNVVLLASERPPAGSCFTWNTPVLVPWAKQRYLWSGSRRST